MSNPYPPQMPTPPQPKKRTWPWIVGAIVALLVVVPALSNDDTKTDGVQQLNTHLDTRTSGPTAEQAAAEPAAAATMNTPVRDGKFEFVVKAVQPGLDQIGDNPFLTETPQGQFVIVTLSVQNIGDRAQSFSPSNQKLFDSQGRSFESDSSAQIALGDSDIPIWDDINPGNAVEVKLVYDMPQGAVPTSIELHDSMFSGGITVALTP